ncbi:hypothetical protein XACM_3334 [Xanthomonas euvesicatoria pv. citrumelo F1]|nr:hypothetical protein XACM_3334 [Xanthomonas euvesicatoria pv. citrumelo F1]
MGPLRQGRALQALVWAMCHGTHPKRTALQADNALKRGGSCPRRKTAVLCERSR